MMSFRVQVANWMVLIILFAATLDAQYVLQPLAPVRHPVTSPVVADVSPAYAWKQGVGGFAETAAEAVLRRQGYREIRTFKSPSGHGVDVMGFRYDAQGNLLDGRIVEAKYDTAKLGDTKSGKQMSRTWLANKMKQLRAAGPEGREASRKLSQVLRNRGVPIEDIGRVFHLNPDGRYTVLDNSGSKVLANGRLDKLLDRMNTHGPKPLKAWAKETNANLVSIGKSSQGSYVSDITSPRRAASTHLGKRLSRASARGLTKAGARAAAKASVKFLARAAGPLGIAIGVVMDSQELYGVLNDYASGRISRNEMIVQVAKLSGGIIGAGAGAWAGAKIGAAAGLLGGPLAWVTVPAGAFFGGAVGGVVGYFVGSTVGERVSSYTLEMADKNVIDRAELAVLGGK